MVEDGLLRYRSAGRNGRRQAIQERLSISTVDYKSGGGRIKEGLHRLYLDQGYSQVPLLCVPILSAEHSFVSSQHR